jgi:phage shock protein E
MKKFFIAILVLAILLASITLIAAYLTRNSTRRLEDNSGTSIPGSTSDMADTDIKDKKAVYNKITPEQAKARMDSGDSVTVVDVRTQREYDGGHIESALLIPNETITNERPELLPDLDAEILLYCRSGNRSAQAAKKLIEMGYTNVYDFGGIKDWPYELVK